MEKQMKHLEMIEGIIERMGSNSFQLKGWAVTLVTLLGALSSKDSDQRFFFLALIPLLAFWFLDSFYLQVERKYRVLYRNVTEKSEAEIDFSMDTRNIVCTEKEAVRIRYCKCLFSRTELMFYLALAGAVGALAWVCLR